LVTNHLNTFSINFEKYVVSSTNDGVKMIIKYGRECPVIGQLCLNHGTEDLLINVNFTLLNNLNTALKLIKLTVEVFNRKDAALISPDLALNFM